MIGPSMDYLEYQYDLANADSSDVAEDDGLEVFDCFICRKLEADCICPPAHTPAKASCESSRQRRARTIALTLRRERELKEKNRGAA